MSDCKYDKMSSVVILAVCFTYNSDLTTGLDDPCKIIIHAVNIGLQMDDKKGSKHRDAVKRSISLILKCCPYMKILLFATASLN